MRSAVIAAALSLMSLAPPGAAHAAGSAPDPDAQSVLAERYAPVVRLVDSRGSCAAGEPYEPTSVDAVLGNPDVALRGPWSKAANLVKVAPTADDLSVGLSRYNLDFPGNALSPGCSYADWQADIDKTTPATVYAHVVTQPGFPGELALQYWFFYLYNDFNDKHEGDWEMIQLDFHADTAAQALNRLPYETGYSQHTGAELATWGTSRKLEIVGGTHPVVYPARGSHADYYTSHLYLGTSAEQGVGCDDTDGPSRDLRPAVVVIPELPAEYVHELPWLAYQGRWGELQRGFNNGATGPATKERWSAPFTWRDTAWRDKSFVVPEGGLLGHAATSFFCSAVAKGSTVVNALLDNPAPVLLVLLGLVVSVIWLATRTQWMPAAALRVWRRRPWGTLLTSSFRMYAAHPRTFLGIGVLVLVPLGLIAAAVQYLIFNIGGLSPLVHEAGDTNVAVETLVDLLGAAFTVVGVTMVQAAVAHAVLEYDKDRPVTARKALRAAFGAARRLAPALAVALVIVALLGLTVFGDIVGLYLIVRWSLFAQAAVIGDGSGRGALRQSYRVTRGHFWRTASVMLFITGFGLLIGPFVGALLLLATTASFTVVNLISAVIDAVISPLIAITATYLYFDLRVRAELAQEALGDSDILPAEA